MADHLEVDTDRLRADIKFWNDSANWWAGINNKICGLLIHDSGPLVQQFVTAHNEAVMKAVQNTSLAPDHMDEIASTIRKAADEYDATDDSNAEGMHEIESKLALGEDFFGKQVEHPVGDKGKKAEEDKPTRPDVKISLKKFGEKEVVAWKDEREASLKLGLVEVSGKESVEVLQAKIEGEADFNLTHGKIDIEGAAEANLWKVSQEEHVKIGPVGLDAEQTKRLGVDGNIGAGFGKDGAEIGVGAFAGAELVNKAHVSAGGITAGATATASIGLGAEADAHMNFGDDGKLHIGAKVGATLGIGGKIGADITVDPQEVTETAGKHLNIMEPLIRSFRLAGIG